ncbi:PREDICTED: uncharacterized protein LOC108545584 [Eufriesea mexicana]|uniref:uncharacterized protein LOC108545584 n=1 Tax=Eufriesea mexicana TaxID=516756 RepID=UPI00083BD413|nr:PREDICTED: uncharacterized protein LOC108545584 [Eufriesea mexicana]
MVLKYNYFFYANVCHVCKRFGKGISLKRCGNCTMISYCCKEHQKIHWSQHKDLCKAIYSVLKDSKIDFLNIKQDINTETWVQMKMNFMLLVAIKIGRKLEHYEEQMFKFLRSCIVCHDQNIKVLEDCPNCPNNSFCVKHKDDTIHDKVCNLMKLCFNLDVILITYKRKIPKIEVPYNTNHTNLPQSMKDFIDCYIKPQRNSQVSKIEETIIDTEYLTRPLTFLYALQKLKYILKSNSIIIHITAANVIDTEGIEIWEILLHWLPNITIIKICLIGPELSIGSMLMNLCKNCQYNNKQFSIQVYDMLYENYAKSDFYTKPNFIIGYNAGIHECEDFKSVNYTWRQSLKIIAKQNCPLILTSYTLSEAKKEQIRLNEILNNCIKCSYFEQNPFSSLRPYRDFETEGIYYQNQYIIMYKNLNTL